MIFIKLHEINSKDKIILKVWYEILFTGKNKNLRGLNYITVYNDS